MNLEKCSQLQSEWQRDIPNVKGVCVCGGGGVRAGSLTHMLANQELVEKKKFFSLATFLLNTVYFLPQ